jgi:hypothetical protein
MNDERLAGAEPANPFRLPRLHAGISCCGALCDRGIQIRRSAGWIAVRASARGYPVVSENSYRAQGRAVVVAQQTAQPLAAPNTAAPERVVLWCDQGIAEPLMVPLLMVVRHELVEHMP